MSALAILQDEEAAAAVMSPLRRRILSALAEPGSATTVGHEIGVPRQKVNYHLRALEDAGLVEHVEDRKRGNCMERIVRATARHYLIAPSVLGDLEASPEEAADRFSSDHLAAVSARTISELAELRRRADEAGKRLATLSMETGIRFATPADQQAFAEALAESLAALVAQYHDETAEHGRWFRTAVGIHPALLERTEETPA
ncbi:MAG: helix-turn-helix domain-containing protein [Gemmatimonadota bacterium]